MGSPWKNAPLVGLNANWSKVVIDKDSGTVNHRAYTFWMLEQVLEALHRRPIYSKKRKVRGPSCAINTRRRMGKYSP